MKKAKVIFGIVSLILFSCSKPVVNSYNKPVQPATAKWQWEYSQGGIGGVTINPSSTSLIAVTLYNDSTYIASLNGSNKQEGKYYFALDSNGNTVLRFGEIVNIENLYLHEEQRVFRMDDSLLEMLDNNITDGFMSHFKKVP